MDDDKWRNPLVSQLSKCSKYWAVRHHKNHILSGGKYMETYTLYEIDYSEYDGEAKFIVGVFDSKEKAETVKRQIEEAIFDGQFGRYADCNLRIEQTT